MITSEVITHLKTIQLAWNVISFYNLTASDYPPDIQASDWANSSYDYIIVGGGLAGSVVTARLVEAGHSVLLLEAGGYPSFESTLPGFVTTLRLSTTDWNYDAEPDGFSNGCKKSNSLFVSKALGGAGTTSPLLYHRGNPSNYDKWSKGNTWKWQNMMKYFKRSESLHDPNILNSPYRQYHGINGKISITRETDNVCDEYIKGFERAGQPVPLDNIGNASLGYSRGLYYVYNGLRTNVNSYIAPLKDNSKIHISLYSLVTKILFDHKKNAVGVEFMKGGTKITVKAKREVILSAGPLKSPQLLMLSGIGPKDQLKQWNITSLSDLPVGRNFQNIVGAVLVFKTNKKANQAPFSAYKFPAPLVVGYAAINESNKYPDYETLNYIVDNYFYLLTHCGVKLNFDNKICDRLYRLAKNTQLMFTVISNLNVESRGRISLKSANPEDQPDIITGYYSNDRDLEAIVKQIQHYMKIVSTPYFKNMGLELLDPTSRCGQCKKESREYWRCYVLCMKAGTYRYVGANSMGAVVDTNLRVYGVHKLRVVDASIIPNTISGSIVAPVVAFAEKASEIIISDAKSM